VYIVKGHVSKGHVHLLGSVPPNIAVSELVKRLKGRSSRLMLEEFGELRRTYWGRHLWARGYFVASSGNVTDEIIAEYIEKQSQLAPEEGDPDFSVEEL
jgi:putative transposase